MPCLVSNLPGFGQAATNLIDKIDEQGDAGHQETNRLVCAGPDYGFNTSESNEDDANDGEHQERLYQIPAHY